MVLNEIVAKPRFLSALLNHWVRESFFLALIQALIDLKLPRIDGLSWGYRIAFLGLPPRADPSSGPQQVPVPGQRLRGIHLHIVELLGAQMHLI